MMNEKFVLGLAGMPGSGKSIVVNVAKESGYGAVVMGDEVRNEAKKRNMQPTPESLGKIMLELRQLEGEAAIAKRCIPKIEREEKHRIIVDGVRSLSEVEEFKKHFHSFVLIAVHASPETRFRRLYHRQRSDDPKNWKIFRERELRELRVGLGNVIATADYMILNEERLKFVKDKVRKTLRRIDRNG
ncbi:MAG: AAA family ATPase [Candidatus Bathyarchaeota archaeon]|nr:AAA family ATPase [Candidatus Bathyarchaeota archaeon]MDH5787363.1 AAA family ATPase [Candidatus Bathyarchaeota archaeon]